MRRLLLFGVVGCGQGFDLYDQVSNTRLLSGGLMEERPADQVVDAALAWLSDVPGRFFLWVHLFDPHHGYAPPPPFRRRTSPAPGGRSRSVAPRRSTR